MTDRSLVQEESDWVCRDCGKPATIAIRSGLESHPTCDDCAEWWPEHRKGPLSDVQPDYEYVPLSATEGAGGSDLMGQIVAARERERLSQAVAAANR